MGALGLPFCITTFMKKICLILMYILAGTAYPCGNEYEGDPMKLDLKKPDGTASYNYLTYQVGFDKEALQKQRNVLLKKLKGKPNSYKILSDIALIDLKIGNKHKAVKLLDSLIKIYPNEYNLNANLGTGYELIGNNKQALKYIKRAVQINSSSHNGSEWIHVNILLQKLKKEPDYTKIMNLGLDKDLSDYNLHGDEMLSQKRVELAYQLNERIAFLGYDDPVVSQLLTDYADLVATTDNILSAKHIYKKALICKKANDIYINRRLGEINNLETWASFKYYTPLILASLVLIALIVLIFKMSDSHQHKIYAYSLGYSVLAFIVMGTLVHVEDSLALLSPLVQFAIPALFVVGYKNGWRLFTNLLFCGLVTGVLLLVSGLLAHTLSGYYAHASIKFFLPWVLCIPTYAVLAVAHQFTSILKNILVGTVVIYTLYFLNSNYLHALWGYQEREFIPIFIGYSVLFLMFIVSPKRNIQQSATASYSS